MRDADHSPVWLQVGESFVCLRAYSEDWPIGWSGFKFAMQEATTARAQSLEWDEALNGRGVLTFGQIGPYDRAGKLESFDKFAQVLVVWDILNLHVPILQENLVARSRRSVRCPLLLTRSARIDSGNKAALPGCVGILQDQATRNDAFCLIPRDARASLRALHEFSTDLLD